MKFLPIVFRNLLRNRRRTILTVLSIALSIFMFAALMSLPAVVNQLLRDSVSSQHLIVSNKAGYLYLLPASYGNTLRTMPHIDAMSGELATIAKYQDSSDQIPVMGLDPAALRDIFSDWRIRPEAASKLDEIRQSGLVSASLARRFNWKIGDKVILHPSMMTFGDIDFTVVGMVGDRAPVGLVILPINRLQHDSFEGKVFTYIVKLDRSENAPLVIQEIDRRFANSASQTQTQTELGAAQMKTSQMRLVFVGVEAIGVIIVLVIAMVAANTAAMTVRERVPELALMRSLGFTRSRLVGLMMAEGLLTGLIAGALGCGAAYGLLLVFPRMSGPLGMLFQLVHLVPSVTIGSLVIAAAIGLASVALPALSATRRTIADTLRAVS